MSFEEALKLQQELSEKQIKVLKIMNNLSVKDNIMFTHMMEQDPLGQELIRLVDINHHKIHAMEESNGDLK